MLLMFVVFVLLALSSLNSASALEVNGSIVTIHNASDFIELSNNVNEK